MEALLKEIEARGNELQNPETIFTISSNILHLLPLHTTSRGSIFSSQFSKKGITQSHCLSPSLFTSHTATLLSSFASSPANNFLVFLYPNSTRSKIFLRASYTGFGSIKPPYDMLP